MGNEPSATPVVHGSNEKILFWASFCTLIAAGIGFSVRGAILGDWGKQFGFTQTELGTITGGGLIGFGVSIIFFSFFADLFGYGKLMRVAFALHVLSAVVTFAATPVFGMYGKEGAYWCLYIGMWLFALGNGTCEAVINPLTASLFPENKTHWLNILHAGWPAGLILGAFITLGLQQSTGIRWEFKLGVFLIPVFLYGLMMFNRPFPKSEASKSGVSVGTMAATLVAPLLIFLFLIHAMVGYVELGTDSWIINITNTVLANSDQALIAFIWTNLLMTVLRFFAGPIVHKINPVGLLFFSAVLGTAGLVLMGLPLSNSMAPWLVAVTIYGIGKTFYWPTMLGVISEQFPRGGALALGVSGGIGMISAGYLGGPLIGYKQDYFASESLKASSEASYERYKAEKPNAPLPFVKPVAGLDNAKVGVLNGGGKDLEKELKAEPENKSLLALESWWKQSGEPNATSDKPKVDTAVLAGGKDALFFTALVPATMALCYLLLLLYFKATGGYKPVHIDGGSAH